MIKKILDYLMMTLFFTVIFFVSYKFLQICNVTVAIKWYVYFLIGFLEMMLFRLIGRFINK